LYWNKAQVVDLRRGQ